MYDNDDYENNDDNYFERENRNRMDDIGNMNNMDDITFNIDIFKKKPRITWNEIIGLKSIRDRLLSRLIFPHEFPDLAKKLDISQQSTKVILYSAESGVGKTSLAHAVSNRLGADLYVIDFSRISSSYYSLTEKKLSFFFSKIKKRYGRDPAGKYSKICVVLLNEWGSALFPRNLGGTAIPPWIVSVIETLLNEIENITQPNIVIILTLNTRIIDKSFIREGRFDIMEVPLPDLVERKEKIESVFAHIDTESFDLELISKMCAGFSYSDIDTVKRFVTEQKFIYLIEKKLTYSKSRINQDDIIRTIQEIKKAKDITNNALLGPQTNELPTTAAKDIKSQILYFYSMTSIT